MSTAARIDDLRLRFQDNPRRYFVSYANELRKLGALEDAIALCAEYLPQVPGHMSGHIVYGQALFEANRLGEARGVFEQALAQDPENLIALRHLGDIDRRRGDAASARRWYERVLEADPRNDDIAAQLATLSTAAALRVVSPSAPNEAATPTMQDSDFAAVLAGATEAASDWSAPVDPADPFRFGAVSEAAVDAAGEGNTGILPDDAPFEEGLVAQEWPDVTALSDRVAGSRRSDTPPAATVVDDATAAAFGGGAASDAVAFDAADDVPAWLRTPVEAIPKVAAPVEQIEAEVTPIDWGASDPVGQESASVSFADVHPDAPIIPISALAPTPVFSAASVTPPIAATPIAATPIAATPIAATPVNTPAFVTATMGELFVAQGFLDRAVAVYEELVRQRPEEAALSHRLADLRRQMTAPPERAAAPRTVRQRFAALAARRVGGASASSGPRPEPAVIALRDDVSLEALFGSGGSDADLRAAQLFAEAFKPVAEAPSDFLSAMDRLPSQPLLTSVATPVVAPVVSGIGTAEPTASFDRYFTDPMARDADSPPARAQESASAKAADDLAEFSAWLKGLGNP
jgi:tetratricopeptide (TPR) repeat protein